MAFLSRVFKNLQWYGMTRSPVFSRKQDFFFAYFCSMGEGMKQSGRMLLPLQ